MVASHSISHKFRQSFRPLHTLQQFRKCYLTHKGMVNICARNTR